MTNPNQKIIAKTKSHDTKTEGEKRGKTRYTSRNTKEPRRFWQMCKTPATNQCQEGRREGTPKQWRQESGGMEAVTLTPTPARAFIVR
jgi:hypothetical protein